MKLENFVSFLEREAFCIHLQTKLFLFTVTNEYVNYF